MCVARFFDRPRHFFWVIALLGLSGLCAAAQIPGAAPAVRIEVLARDLEHPWALAFIDGGRMLVSERPGRLRLVQAGGELGPPIAGLPKVDAVGQGGLLDVVAD